MERTTEVNAAERAYLKIRNAILDGTFPPERTLKETELVEYCDVSRTPVREALRRLAAEHFVLMERNRSARVKGWSAADLDDLFALRAVLESYAAARAARRISARELETIDNAIRSMDEVLAVKGQREWKIEAFLRYNRTVHETVWRAAGSDRLIQMLRHLVEQALMFHTARRYTVPRIAESHHHHGELLRALQARDEAWAGAIMTSHIRAAHHALVEPLPDSAGVGTDPAEPGPKTPRRRTLSGVSNATYGLSPRRERTDR